MHEVEALCDRGAVLRASALVGTFDLVEQRRLAPRQVTVRFAAPVPAHALEGIEGASVVEADGARAVFTVTNGVDALVKRIAAFPVLEIDDITIHESNAICWYLAERFPGGKLLPDVGTKARAACLQWTNFSDGTLGSAKSYLYSYKDLQGKISESPLAQDAALATALESVKKEADEEMKKSLAALESALAGKQYLCGDFSVADIATAYSLAWTAKSGALKDFPALQSYVDRCAARPAAVKSGAFKRD